MKKFKKLTSVVAATLMAASMVAPAAFNTFADDDAEQQATIQEDSIQAAPPDNKTFTMSAPAVGVDNIKAVQIFTVDETATEFMVNGWGTGVTATMQKELASVVGITDSTDADKVADAITTDNANAFAKKAATLLKDVAGESGTYASGKVTFGKELEKGYYVVTCTAGEGDAKSYSLGMLTTVDGKNTSIGKGNAKVALPTVQKKVYEETKPAEGVATYEAEDKNWNDIADYDIGDAVPFKLYGTMPGNINQYDHYYYEFSDTLDSQFTLEDNVKFTIKVNGTAITLEPTEDVPELYTYTDEAKGTTTDVWIKKGTDEDGKTTINIIFEDVKALGVNKDSVITVEYVATLNKTAVVGRPGQDNAVKLIYSNNPNVEYIPTSGNPDKPDTPDEDEKSKTPEDRVRVYTYAIEIEKQFFAGSGTPLTIAEVVDVFQGVEFSLKDKDGNYIKVKKSDDAEFDYVVDGTSKTYDDSCKLTLSVVDDEGNEWTVNEEAKTLTYGETVLTAKQDDDGTWYLEKADGTKLTEEEVAKFRMVIRVKGFDDGTYTLTEEEAPAHYSKADDTDIIINADTDNSQETNLDSTADNGGGLKTFVYKIGENGEDKTADDATADVIIENHQGITIPSTGGIGTKLFYLGGGAMVAVAGIFLITKKRMGKE